MQIIRTAPITFLHFREETTVNELKKFLPLGQELIGEAARLGLPVTGPVDWHYYNFSPDPDHVFTLDVSLPVGHASDAYDGRFHVKRTETFPCVCELHAGSWYDLPATYQRIMTFISATGLVPNGQNRELYVNVDFSDPDANQTIVQIGVQS